MLEIIAVSTFAVALTVVLKSQKTDSSKLIGSRASMLTVGVQIICGDCSGHDHFPIKTLLGREGTCAQCGGRSYILASNRVSYAQQIMMARLAEHENVPNSVSIKSIESPSRLSTTEIESVTAFEGWSLVT